MNWSLLDRQNECVGFYLWSTEQKVALNHTIHWLPTSAVRRVSRGVSYLCSRTQRQNSAARQTRCFLTLEPE